jgi:alpha-D-ribose 1-methylphosphonate 5-triphosphate synthase subunit PhnG
MKFKSLCFGLLFIFILSFSSTVSASELQSDMYNEIRVISSNTNLKIGDLGYIIIKGKPGVRYNLRTTYELGDRVVTVSQIRGTDANGEATFNWVVENGTTPGTHTATISGGGASINVTHTVR